MLDAFKKLIAVLDRVSMLIAGAVFCLAFALLVYDIILRTAFNSSVNGLHELVVVMFIYVFMLGAVSLYARNEDVNIPLLVDALGPRSKTVVMAISHLCVFMIMAVVAFYSIRLLPSWHAQKTPALGFRKSWELAPVIYGTAIIALTGVLNAWRLSVGEKVERDLAAAHAEG